MTINKIVRILISITSFVLFPVRLVSTIVLGLIVSLTFGILQISINFIWRVLFLGPLLGLSYVYERISSLSTFAAIMGIPIAVLGNAYVALMPSMGQIQSQLHKFILCRTFPLSWKFLQFERNALNIGKGDVLSQILKELAATTPLNSYLARLRIDVYSRPDYLNGKYKLDW